MISTTCAQIPCSLYLQRSSQKFFTRFINVMHMHVDLPPRAHCNGILARNSRNLGKVTFRESVQKLRYQAAVTILEIDCYGKWEVGDFPSHLPVPMSGSGSLEE